jgi:hypothetical protein
MKCSYCDCEHSSPTYITMQSTPLAGLCGGHNHGMTGLIVGANGAPITGNPEGYISIGCGTFAGNNIPLLSQKKKNNLHNWSFCSFECLILKILQSNVDDIAEKEFLG